MKWRVGSHVGRTVYLQAGEQPSRADQLIGVMDTPELAAVVVTAVNARYETPPPDWPGTEQIHAEVTEYLGQDAMDGPPQQGDQ